MKNLLKLFGNPLIIALVAAIGFSMAACDINLGDDPPIDDGRLPAPTLTATALSSSEIFLTWNTVAGAEGYNVYEGANSSSGFTKIGTKISTSVTVTGVPAGKTAYYKVAAISANGTEGAASNVASATTLSVGVYSIEGVWVSSGGAQVTISGSTGVYNAFGASPLSLDAASKNYVHVGDQKFRKLTSTGTNKWSGEELLYMYNTNSPNVCIRVEFHASTFTISSDGNTLTALTPDSVTPSSTWTRISNLSIEGVWVSKGGAVIVINGATGVYNAFGTPSPLLSDAINKGYVHIGDQKFRNLTSTGTTNKWSGQELLYMYNTNSPNVCIRVEYHSSTLTISSDGNTLTTYTPDSVTPTGTWTRY